jgi:hypothetical protein
MSSGTQEARGVIITASEAEMSFEGSNNKAIEIYKSSILRVICMGLKLGSSV